MHDAFMSMLQLICFVVCHCRPDAKKQRVATPAPESSSEAACKSPVPTLNLGNAPGFKVMQSFAKHCSPAQQSIPKQPHPPPYPPPNRNVEDDDDAHEALFRPRPGIAAKRRPQPRKAKPLAKRPPAPPTWVGPLPKAWWPPPPPPAQERKLNTAEEEAGFEWAWCIHLSSNNMFK